MSFFSWCQIVCFIMLVPNCPLQNCPLLLCWCQIVLLPNCLVPNCPGAKLSWCQIVRCQIVRCQIVLPPYQHQYHRQHPTSAELPVPTFCTKKMYFLLDPSKREESPRKFCCFCMYVYLPVITSVEFYGSSKESKYT